MSEFDLIVTELKSGQDESLRALAGPSIMFMTSGSGTMIVQERQWNISAGYVYFIGKGIDVAYRSISDDFTFSVHTLNNAHIGNLFESHNLG